MATPSGGGAAQLEILCCENSPMRKAISLNEYPWYYDCFMSLVVPTAFRTISNCSGHMWQMYNDEDCPNGYGSKCMNCGCINLEVAGNMMVNFPAGNTKTIIADANKLCYRMAIGIRYENEANTWFESLNTGLMSCSYKFDRVGLYTITISARDIDPDCADGADSVVAQHIYTIRAH